MKTWLISDTHFGHANIIEYSQRPLADLPEMNRELMRRWTTLSARATSSITSATSRWGSHPNGTVFCKNLRGRNILIRANHDRKEQFMREVSFEEVWDNIVVEIGGVRVWMNHYPLARHEARDLKRPELPGEYDIAVCGHVHRAFEVRAGVVNVGVDVGDYAPTTLDRIQRRLREVNGCA